MAETNATPRARRRARRRDWQARFIDAFRQSANVSLACRAGSVARATAYRERERNAQFAGAWADAIAEATDVLHAEAWKRAIEGIRRPVFQGGTLVGHIVEYSDETTEMLLRMHRPEMFGGKAKQPLVAGPAPITATPEEVLKTFLRVRRMLHGENT